MNPPRREPTWLWFVSALVAALLVFMLFANPAHADELILRPYPTTVRLTTTYLPAFNSSYTTGYPGNVSVLEMHIPNTSLDGLTTSITRVSPLSRALYQTVPQARGGSGLQSRGIAPHTASPRPALHSSGLPPDIYAELQRRLELLKAEWAAEAAAR